MKEPTGLEILKNSGYEWAKEAAEVMEEMKEALAIAEKFLHFDCDECPKEITEAFKKFKEWNER